MSDSLEVESKCAESGGESRSFEEDVESMESFEK